MFDINTKRVDCLLSAQKPFTPFLVAAHFLIHRVQNVEVPTDGGVSSPLVIAKSAYTHHTHKHTIDSRYRDVQIGN